MAVADALTAAAAAGVVVVVDVDVVAFAAEFVVGQSSAVVVVDIEDG